MKVVILAGGFGTRLGEETNVKPKPMVEIGGYPILWHIMKHYAYYGFNEFVIALGYKSEVIKRYFLDYHALNSSITIHLAKGKVEVYNTESEDWRVHLVDTGIGTLTGGRVRRLAPWIQGESFMLTYGDGVSNLDLRKLLDFHHFHGRLATLTAVRPSARFGGLTFEGNIVTRFAEKPQIGEGWINGGFMIFEPSIFDYLESDKTSLEKDALEKLAADRQLMAYQYDGFWQCMDTLRDVRLLESLWETGQAPWKLWK